MRNNHNQNITFYYYGQEHLILNIYKYIRSQIEENTYVFLCCHKDISTMIKKSFNSNEHEMMSTIKFDNIILEIILSLKELTHPNFAMSKLNDFITEKGFLGGAIVIDATYLIKSIGELNFLEYLKLISNICNENNLSVMTCYDFSDYINYGKVINETIIRNSYLNHDYRFYSNKIINIEEFNICYSLD